MALNYSSEFCLTLTYRYLLKAGHVLVTPGVGRLWPEGHTLNQQGRGPLGHATYQISNL